jgi:hypothetical protein
MKTTDLITEKSQDSPKVLPDQKTSETEGSLKTKPRFISEAFLIKHLDERMSMPLKLRPLGFSRDFGLND